MPAIKVNLSVDQVSVNIARVKLDLLEAALPVQPKFKRYFFENAAACGNCNGTGWQGFADYCRACRGLGIRSWADYTRYYCGDLIEAGVAYTACVKAFINPDND